MTIVIIDEIPCSAVAGEPTGFPKEFKNLLLIPFENPSGDKQKRKRAVSKYCNAHVGNVSSKVLFQKLLNGIDKHRHKLRRIPLSMLGAWDDRQFRWNAQRLQF